MTYNIKKSREKKTPIYKTGIKYRSISGITPKGYDPNNYDIIKTEKGNHIVKFKKKST